MSLNDVKYNDNYKMISFIVPMFKYDQKVYQERKKAKKVNQERKKNGIKGVSRDRKVT